jgi:predicted membrane protein
MRPRSRKDQLLHGIFWGGALLLFGVLFLLQELGHLGAFAAWDFWPLLLIGAGLMRVFRKGRRLSGLVLLALGSLLLMHTLSVLSVSWGLVWPILLIGLGLYLVYQVVNHRHTFSAGPVSAGQARGSAVMSGREDRNDSDEFEGGEVSAVMGSYELDLSLAEMKGDRAVLAATAVMGSVEIRTPSHWRVEVHGDPILGSVEDNTRPPPAGSEHPKTLIIKATAVMGSVEIRN